jgi:hypothetical protein
MQTTVLSTTFHISHVIYNDCELYAYLEDPGSVELVHISGLGNLACVVSAELWAI